MSQKCSWNLTSMDIFHKHEILKKGHKVKAQCLEDPPLEDIDFSPKCSIIIIIMAAPRVTAITYNISGDITGLLWPIYNKSPTTELNHFTRSVVYLTIPLRRLTAIVCLAPSLKPRLNPSWSEASSPASIPSTYPSCTQQHQCQQLPFTSAWNTATAHVKLTLNFTLIRFFMLDAHSLLSKPSSSASSSKTSSPLSDTALTQDIFKPIKTRFAVELSLFHSHLSNSLQASSGTSSTCDGKSVPNRKCDIK